MDEKYKSFVEEKVLENGNLARYTPKYLAPVRVENGHLYLRSGALVTNQRVPRIGSVSRR